MAPAVSVIRCTGRTPRRITHHITRPSTPSTASTAAASTATRRRTASSTSSSGSAMHGGARRRAARRPAASGSRPSDRRSATVTVSPARERIDRAVVEARAWGPRGLVSRGTVTSSPSVGQDPDVVAAQGRGTLVAPGRPRTRRAGRRPAGTPLLSWASTWSMRCARVARAMATAATAEHERDERGAEQEAGPERHGRLRRRRAACSPRPGSSGSAGASTVSSLRRR